MKTRAWLHATWIAGALAIVACIPTLHPLYTDKDLVYDPALVGQWTTEDGTETWTFSRANDKEYDLETLDNEGKEGAFVVHLLTIGDARFIDLLPDKPKTDASDFQMTYIVPVHTFFRVRGIGKTLDLSFLKPDWLEAYLKENPKALAHEMQDGQLLVTAQPKDMQAFLLKHMKDADAWEDCDPLTRKSEAKK